METRSGRRRRLEEEKQEELEGGVDYISDLPDAVLHKIMCLLPIKTIAQTTVLSSRWRSLWTSLPDLDFNNNINSKDSDVDADVITRILNARDHKHWNVRVLRFRSSLSFSSLNALFRTAIRHRVQELDVQVTTNDYFNFPRSVIASDSLRVFKLRSVYPGFRLPPSSVMASGFRSLNSLSLALVVFYHRPSLLDTFSHSSFPLLKKLNLESCFGLRHLRIACPLLQDFTLHTCFQLQGLDVSSPNLESLRISSCFDAYNRSSVKIAAPNLKTLLWTYNAIPDEFLIDHFTSLNQASLGLLQERVHTRKLQALSSLLLGISTAHSLTLETQCIDVLSINNYFTCYLPSFNNVKYLELQTVFRKHNGHCLANIFRSCPILETLTIKITNGTKIGRKDWRRDVWDRVVAEEEQFWEAQIQPLKSFLLHLKIVRIHEFTECLNEVSLIQFLLKRGTALQEITICTRNSNHRDSLRRQEIKSQIMAVSRASSNVTIQYH